MDRLVLVIILLGTVALVCLGGVIFLAASSAPPPALSPVGDEFPQPVDVLAQ
jgi:hypothetical protein